MIHIHSIFGTFLSKWRILCPAHPLLRKGPKNTAFSVECRVLVWLGSLLLHLGRLAAIDRTAKGLAGKIQRGAGAPLCVVLGLRGFLRGEGESKPLLPLCALLVLFSRKKSTERFNDKQQFTYHFSSYSRKRHIRSVLLVVDFFSERGILMVRQTGREFHEFRETSAGAAH